MDSCIFCRIITREIPASIIYENDTFLVFRDIHPKAATHWLIIPRAHLESVDHMEDSERTLGGDIFLLARDLAKQYALVGYQLHINVGKAGGQEVPHLHVHLLSDTLTN